MSVAGGAVGCVGEACPAANPRTATAQHTRICSMEADAITSPRTRGARGQVQIFRNRDDANQWLASR